jgi:hypothetical protein
MLKPFAAIALVAVLLAGGAYALMRSAPRTANAVAAGGSSCAGSTPATAAAHDDGAAAAGSCQSSCATPTAYQEADLVAQPDVKSGALTRCLVNGEVFRVDDAHPHLRLAGHEYVFCCDDCAKKFRADPAHYVSL